jgi:hypothetical protein
MKFVVLRKTLDCTRQNYWNDRAYLSLSEVLGSIVIVNSYYYDNYKFLTLFTTVIDIIAVRLHPVFIFVTMML